MEIFAFAGIQKKKQQHTKQFQARCMKYTLKHRSIVVIFRLKKTNVHWTTSTQHNHIFSLILETGIVWIRDQHTTETVPNENVSHANRIMDI